jgi:hypothetical protein
MNIINCPKCKSTEIHYRKKKANWICDDCDFVFEKEDTHENMQESKVKFPSRNIFISYGHDQFGKFACRLKEDLEKRGHKVWIDHELKAGDDWEIEIETALNKLVVNKPNSCFLFLMCPHAVRRPDGYCLNELSVAVSNEVFILPIKLTNLTPPLSIARIQWIDLIGIDLDLHKASFEEKEKALIEALENEKLDFEGSFCKLQSVLKPIHFKAEIQRYTENFIGRKWILEDIRSWLNDENSSKVFWITGGPGVGKTAISLWLSCCVVEQIRAWHLCQHSNTITSDPKRCVLSIAFFLSAHLEEYRDFIARLNLTEIANNNSSTIFNELLIQPLNQIKEVKEPVVILIDALDESADENGRNELAKFIGLNFGLLPSWIKLIVTSRPVNEVTKWFRKLNPYFIDANDPKNIADVSSYIRKDLLKLNLDNQTMDSVIDNIIKKSEGNFLYAEYVCKSIIKGELDYNNVSDFPDGLECIYENYFERRFEDLKDYRVRVAPLLRIIVASYIPLSLPLFSDILKSDYLYNEEGILQLKKDLGALFVFKDESILPFHKSISDWLTSDRNSDFYISKKEGHAMIANWALYQFNQENYQNEYILKFIVQHIVYAGNVNTACEILNSEVLFEERTKLFGFDNTIQFFFNDLKGIYNLSNSKTHLIFQSRLFKHILSSNRRYLMDYGFYIDLKEMGFSAALDNVSFQNISRGEQTAILYYYYLHEDYRKVINLVSYIQNEIEKESTFVVCQIYEVLGMCLRKIGDFNLAKQAYDSTIKLANDLNDNYQKSIGYMSMAKLDYHEGDFKSAYFNNKHGIEALRNYLDEQVREKTDLQISVKMFLAEYHRLSAETCIWNSDFIKAKELLTYTKEIYESIQIRNRYFVRFLYNLAQLETGLGNWKKALFLLSDSKKLVRNKYDTGAVDYFSAVALLSKYNDTGDKNLLPIAMDHIKNSVEVYTKLEAIIELLEAKIIEKLIKKIQNPSIEKIEIGNFDQHKIWAKHVLTYIFSNILNNERINYTGKWRLDSNTEKGNLLLFISN